MKAIRTFASPVFACFVLSAVLAAQQPVADQTVVANSTQAVSASVPRLIRYTGTLSEPSGKPLTGAVEVEFAIYKEQVDDTPLWKETQSLELDAQGHYSVLLGATQPDGLPAELFSSGMGRWLGVEAAGAAAQPHVLLVAVPYALKASDADTLGGKPASAFVLSPSSGDGSNLQTSDANPGPTSSGTTKVGRKADQASLTSVGGTGAPNYLPLWTSSSALGDSVLYQIGGNVGVATIGVPGARLDTNGTGIGIRGTSSGVNGTGVFGNATAAIGTNFGVYGHTASTSTNAAGVNGNASANTGQVFGVSGFTASTTNYAAAVNGWEGATTGQVFGVNGGTSSTTNFAAGVHGQSTPTSGIVYGVSGNANSSTSGAAAVNGYEAATTGQVYGVSGGTSSTTQGAAAVNGYEGGATGAVFGVNGGTNSTTQGAAAVNGFEGGATGAVFGVNGGTNSTTNGAAGVNGGEGATTGVVYGVSGGSSSATANAAGVNGWEGAATGAVFGVNGNTNSTGPGAAAVNGYEGATTGQVIGVSGGTNSTTNGAAGVSGFEGATTGQVFGVNGGTNSSTNGAAAVNGNEGAATGQVFGVSGFAKSTTNGAAAVTGYESAASGQVYGVFGGTSSTSNGAAGVSGSASGTTGVVYGVTGTSNSTQGIGVWGSAAATSGPAYGVLGWTASPGGVAGSFENTSGSGLVLQGTSGPSFTNVFTVDASGNGYFGGNLNVTGKLTKGSGSFKIDHPLDPANKYLSHSFVESPDMKNVYDGVTKLDANGEAWVTLPDYFEALNRDFRYQLTSIGAPAPNLYVAEEVSGNRFKIAGGKPGGKVSWQVTGIRQDAYANAHRIPVEEAKPPAEQGYYLHPELYGQPDARRVGSAQPATHAQNSGSRDSITAEAHVAASPNR